VSGLVIARGWHDLKYDTGIWPGLILAIAGAAYWEWRAYNSAVEQATGRFPLDTRLLRDNAIIAATYIALGAVLGFSFHLKLDYAPYSCGKHGDYHRRSLTLQRR